MTHSLRLPPEDYDYEFDPVDDAARFLRERMDRRGIERKAKALTGLSFGDWVAGVPEPRGPIDLRTFAFQIEPLYSQAAVEDQEQVHCKATQVGWSTGALRNAIYQAAERQMSVLYTFPTDKELAQFSKLRINPVVDASTYLRAMMTGVNTAEQKQFGRDGWLFFRGTNKPIDSLPIDVLIADEYDTSNLANLSASEYRMSGLQSLGLTRRLGVPSIPGWGIDKEFEASDQRIWTVQCTGCNHYNPIRGMHAFQNNVDQERVMLVCEPCRKPIDVRDGQWVATFPDRTVKGYHVPKLLVPGRKILASVIKNSKKTIDYEVTDFHTRDLAIAHAESKGRLSLEAVKACVRPDLRLEQQLYGANVVTMGIDQAISRPYNVTIEEHVYGQSVGRKVHVGELRGTTTEDIVEELARLMMLFQVNMAVIDNEPDGRLARQFAAKFPGRVYRGDFRTPAASGRKEPPTMDADDEEQFVLLWRSRVYDAVFDRYRQQRVLLPPLETMPWDEKRNHSIFAAHLGNLFKRVVEVTKKVDGRDVQTGATRVEYLETGDHDYAQCEAYNLAAIELFYRAVGKAQENRTVSLVDHLGDNFKPTNLTSYDEDPEYR